MAKKSVVKESELVFLPVADVIPTSDCTRVLDESSEEFRALVATVKAQGIRVPVHVRPHPTRRGKWDLRAGKRRLAAAKAAGLKVIPAVVHRRMSDDDARTLTFQENFDREDLRPLEEGTLVADLLDKLGGDVKAVAARLGRKYTWVAQRAQIARGLAPEWKKAASGPRSPVAAWSARALALVARLPAGVQIDLLRELSERRELSRVNLADVEEFVTKRLRPLEAIRWRADDESLVPKAGPCSKCLKRSNVQPSLWDDWPAIGKKGADRCLDAECWQAKAVAQARRDIAAMKAEGKSALLIAGSGVPYYEQEEAKKAFGNFLGAWQYKRVPRGAKGAVPGIVVCGDGFGEKRWVAPEPDHVAAPKAEAAPTSLAERRAALESKRLSEVLVRLADRVRAAEIEGVVPVGGGVATVMALASVFGAGEAYVPTGDWEDVDGVLGKGPGARGALAALWERVRGVLADRLTYNGPITRVAEDYRSEARRAAAILGVDLGGLYREVCAEKGFTEPRSWAALEAEEKRAKKFTRRAGVARGGRAVRKTARPASPFKKAAANGKRLRAKASAGKSRKGGAE